SRELLDALSIVHLEVSGIEADDLCGTVAKMASREGYQVEVFTSDKDYLQLIDENITINLLKRGLSDMERMDPSTMPERFGFSPLQIIDYKGLCGDSSDNLPGIPGVGEKTAVKLINEYQSFEKIVEAAENGLIKGKLGENIKEHKDLGRECYKLATIKLDAELPFSLEDLVYPGYDFPKMNGFCQKYELKQFAARLPIKLKIQPPEEKEITPIRIASLEGLSLPSSLGIHFDVDLEDYHQAEILGIAISDGEKAYYLSQEHLGEAALKRILEDEKIQKNVYDGKAAIYAAKRLGISLKGIRFDALLAAYLLDSSIKGEPSLVFAHFGVDLTGGEKEQLSLFQEGDPTGTCRIAYFAKMIEEKAFSELRSNDVYSLYDDIELPLSAVLAQMEIEGFPLDGKELSEIGEAFRQKARSLEKEVIELAGESFNIASPKQVANILYVKLGLGNGKEKSTSIEALKEIAGEHPIVGKILEYRKYAKLVGTYIDGFLPHIEKDGRIHTYFNQAQTATGRLSSSKPNLQNISARDEEGKLIRKAFYYPEGEYSILSLDYGQIELRVLAALSHCEKYIEVFNEGRDVHTETAKFIFHHEEVTPLERRRAKAVNFAIIYGTTPFGLAEQIEGTPYEAKQIIESFYLAYPEIGEYLRSIIQSVERKGYVETMFGRRRYLRDITDGNYMKREAAKRQALNAPVQGSAADLIKIAMLHIDSFLKEGGYESKMVLQIHDELLF
ncbi:MAG: DNA polymerase I, partial [Bacilli bacterium]|nr:DNA polymerase I [Bacilli bacterium]